ncbi:AfsR/SARP family transcriptional regulator [Saccharothrix hoggarensis]|uniref:BTAD domain-containing putative transcriptional regulator n=1 Tax=Saccharothrix hoggarensis TaxID=913853 RepID=A0ABW3R4G6_9PSEU
MGTGELRIALLGPLDVRVDGEDRTPTAPRLLPLLAVLATRPGRPVQVDALVTELWPEHAPHDVRRTLRTYVHHLRRGLAPARVLTSSCGYALELEPARVDVFAYRSLHQRGVELMARRDHPGAARAFRDALDLWSGPPLSGVRCGPALSAYALHLLDQQRVTRGLRIEAEIAGGLHRELIGTLRSLTEANPLDEGLHGQLIRVLGRCGRRSDAVESYRGLRARLLDELGVEPSDELQSLHRSLLAR